ncbi:hypothetical protein CATMIT_02435, partial [Catenibacterium mitsuokai DSM 15897]
SLKSSPVDYGYSNKIIKSPKSGNKDRLLILRVDYGEDKSKVLLNDEPAEVLLTVYHNEDGSFTVVEGKNAKKYLYDS